MTIGDKTKKIGFIGLGAMGSRMAQRLISAGYGLTVYDRTVEKTDIAVSCGARRAVSPKELAECSDVIITMVSDDCAVRAVTQGEIGTFFGAKPGTVFIDCSTISVDTTKDLSKQAERLGCHWLDAPVLMGISAAETGELPFVIGGSEDVLKRNEDIFKTLGQKIFWMGDSGMGQAVKIVHNLTCGISLIAFSEAIILGEKLGLNRKQILAILENGALASPLLKAKAPKFEQNNFEPSFALAMMGKDLTLAKDAADALHITLPAASLAKKLYDFAKAHGLGAEDSSAIIKAYEASGGNSESLTTQVRA